MSKKIQKTNAMRILDQKKIEYRSMKVIFRVSMPPKNSGSIPMSFLRHLF